MPDPDWTICPPICPQGGRSNPTQSIWVLHRKEVFSYQNTGRVAEQAKQDMFTTEIQLKKANGNAKGGNLKKLHTHTDGLNSTKF